MSEGIATIYSPESRSEFSKVWGSRIIDFVMPHFKLRGDGNRLEQTLGNFFGFGEVGLAAAAYVYTNDLGVTSWTYLATSVARGLVNGGLRHFQGDNMETSKFAKTTADLLFPAALTVRMVEGLPGRAVQLLGGSLDALGTVALTALLTLGEASLVPFGIDTTISGAQLAALAAAGVTLGRTLANAPQWLQYLRESGRRIDFRLPEIRLPRFRNQAAQENDDQIQISTRNLSWGDGLRLKLRELGRAKDEALERVAGWWGKVTKK
jgi:hypothetical protein